MIRVNEQFMKKVMSFSILAPSRYRGMEEEIKEQVLQERKGMWYQNEKKKRILPESITVLTLAYANGTWMWNKVKGLLLGSQQWKEVILKGGYAMNRMDDSENNECVCGKIVLYGWMKYGMVEMMKYNTLKCFGHLEKMKLKWQEVWQVYTVSLLCQVSMPTKAEHIGEWPTDIFSVQLLDAWLLWQ